MAEIARLKRKADIEVRVVSIPGDWSPPVPGVFIKETMNDLADLGRTDGRGPGELERRPPPPSLKHRLPMRGPLPRALSAAAAARRAGRAGTRARRDPIRRVGRRLVGALQELEQRRVGVGARSRTAS